MTTLINSFILQIPSEIPHPDSNTPLDFSNPMEILFYIGAPILIILCFILLRYQKRKKKK